MAVAMSLDTCLKGEICADPNAFAEALGRCCKHCPAPIIDHHRFSAAAPDWHAGRKSRHACQDRKSTRLNSSHLGISYAVFCLKKKMHTTAWSRCAQVSVLRVLVSGGSRRE